MFQKQSVEQKKAKLLNQILGRIYPSKSVAEKGIRQIKSRIDPAGSYKVVQDSGEPGPDGPYWKIVRA